VLVTSRLMDITIGISEMNYIETNSLAYFRCQRIIRIGRPSILIGLSTSIKCMEQNELWARHTDCGVLGTGMSELVQLTV
jgi:hypothetical protein